MHTYYLHGGFRLVGLNATPLHYNEPICNMIGIRELARASESSDRPFLLSIAVDSLE